MSYCIEDFKWMSKSARKIANLHANPINEELSGYPINTVNGHRCWMLITIWLKHMLSVQCRVSNVDTIDMISDVY